MCKGKGIAVVPILFSVYEVLCVLTSGLQIVTVDIDEKSPRIFEMLTLLSEFPGKEILVVHGFLRCYAIKTSLLGVNAGIK